MLAIRPTGEDDLSAVVDMEAAPDTWTWLGGIARAWHELALADPDVEHLVAETTDPAGKEVIGFAVLAGVSSKEATIEIRRIVISVGARGFGAGRALLRAVVARAYGSHGASRVWLDVVAENARARGLYESEAFVVERTVDGGLTSADGRRHDLLILGHRR